MSPTSKKRAARRAMETHSMSERAACRLVGLPRSTQRRALVLADRTDYALSGEGAAAERAAVFGEGQRHRIVDLASADIDAVRAELGPTGTPHAAAALIEQRSRFVSNRFSSA